MSNYRYGIRKERQVGKFLGRHGFRWRQVPGSRGPFDLVARRGSECWLVQVKATRSGGDPRAAFRRALDEASALRDAARQYRRVYPHCSFRPVVVVVEGNYALFFDVSR